MEKSKWLKKNKNVSEITKIVNHAENMFSINIRKRSRDRQVIWIKQIVVNELINRKFTLNNIAEELNMGGLGAISNLRNQHSRWIKASGVYQFISEAFQKEIGTLDTSESYMEKIIEIGQSYFNVDFKSTKRDRLHNWPRQIVAFNLYEKGYFPDQLMPYFNCNLKTAMNYNAHFKLRYFSSDNFKEMAENFKQHLTQTL